MLRLLRIERFVTFIDSLCFLYVPVSKILTRPCYILPRLAIQLERYCSETEIKRRNKTFKPQEIKDRTFCYEQWRYITPCHCWLAMRVARVFPSLRQFIKVPPNQDRNEVTLVVLFISRLGDHLLVLAISHCNTASRLVSSFALIP